MKRLLPALLTIFFLFSFSGCQDFSGGKLKVCVTLYPLYDFTSKLAGDKVEIVYIRPSGDHHSGELSAGDMRAIEGSDLLIYNGAGLEKWLENIINEGLVKAVSASKGIELIYTDEDHTGDVRFADPHVWLDPLRAKKQMENILDALTEADPENADFYQQNYQHYAAEFDILDEQYLQELSELSLSVIVATHKAYGYLCGRYGLEQLAAFDEHNSGEAGAGDFAWLVDEIRERGITAVFYDELEGDEVARALSTETGASVLPLSTIAALTPAQESGGEDYFSVMRLNLDALKSALK